MPRSLLKHAKCIATFPNVGKLAFVFGGAYGQGLVSCRVTNGGWSKPAFLTIADASFGLQAGIESLDLVLVFVNPNAVGTVASDNLHLGVSVTVAAGPLGRDARLGTDYTLKSEVYSYSRTRGLFAGVSLAGAIVDVDELANTKIYGRSMAASPLLRMDDRVAIESETRSRYVPVLNRISP
jgi:lipid-binding SYLF domain-containing protein